MKSIQTKIICLIVIGITVSASVIGGISTFRFRKAMEKECIDIMNMTCYEKAEEINIVLDRVEQSVNILAEFALDNLVGIEQLSDDSEYCLRYTKELEDLGLTIANETEGAIAVYVRFNPDITSPKAGFFRSIVSEKKYLKGLNQPIYPCMIKMM